MKKFNLQDALDGKPVITRDGRPVMIAYYNDEALKSDQIIGYINSSAWSWYKDGTMGKKPNDADLFMAPIDQNARKEWVVRANCGRGAFFQGPYLDYASALIGSNELQRNNYTATIHEITISEGESDVVMPGAWKNI